MVATTNLKVPVSTVPIVHTALERELTILKININNTMDKLKSYEKKHGISSRKFYQKFNNGKMGDSEEIMLWVSEYEALLEIKKEYGDLKKRSYKLSFLIILLIRLINLLGVNP